MGDRPPAQPRPTRRRRPALALGAAALALLTACSGSPGSGPSASPSAPASTSESAPPSGGTTPSTSASPSLATLPASECLTGEWKLVRFVGASDQTYGTGQGGDVAVRFGDGTYTLTGAGSDPITVTLGGGSAELLVDGTAEGSWSLKDATATFTQRSAKGSATIRAGGQTQRLTMDQVTSVVGLSGDGQVACTADAMTVTLAKLRLELARA